MKKMMFLMLALFIGVSASAQSLPNVNVENQEGISGFVRYSLIKRDISN